MSRIARDNGYKVIKLPDSLAQRLASYCITTKDVLPKNHDLEPVNIDDYREQVAWLRKLDNLISAPNFTIKLFANRDDSEKGRADLEDNIMWLSVGLFSAGNELELARTYLHELGHLMSQSGDATKKFEYALDGIAGRLALAYLDGSEATK